MSGLFLHTGNQLETLVDELAALLSTSPPSPLRPEVVLVQSLGMHRWVALQLARRLGICMQVEFPFPRAFLGKALAGLVPEWVAFSPETATWQIHHLLPSLVADPAFEPIRRYTEDGDPLKAYQLASRLANLFDQYLTYRPTWLMEWENADPETLPTDGDAAWQARLWRELNRRRQCHFAAALEKVLSGATTETPNGLPDRLAIFGISSLPPAQVTLFFHLSNFLPVHCFLLAPSPEYHGDDLTPKQRARRGLPTQTPNGGNPLLTTFGRLNAHFTEVILETDERAGHRIVDETERFTEPAGDTLLHRLQRDIYLARAPGVIPDDDEEATPAPPISEDDRSLQIHVCHSPMREVEILHDQLLALLDGDHGGLPGLVPGEILVMAPDIELYAPLIHAVFGYPEEPALRIPFSVADRHPRSDSPSIDLFLRLLELSRTRCTGPQLYDLLQSAPMRRRFGFEESDLEQIHAWVDHSGIRWGIDADHRETLGLPRFEANTWRSGLDRLLLGYAMSGQNRVAFEGIIPHDDVEGGDAELLGRFVAAVEAVFATCQSLQTPRKLSEWPGVLTTLLDRFFETAQPPSPAEVEAIRELRKACLTTLQHLATEAEAALPERNAAEPPLVTVDVIRETFLALLGEGESHGRFLTGGVTFCALKPMRSIPARVICLLGMDDGAFPRRPVPVPFDLMTRHWKLGDRSVRDDDRYIFLEALLSARDRLLISTIGRSQKSNEAIPPSIVVSELLDYLEATDWFAPGAVRRQIVCEHRLHAFSPHYFQQGEHPDARLWSYSKANAVTAEAILRPRATQTPPFAIAPLPAREATLIPLDGFVRFFGNPARFFLEKRLGLRLDERAAALMEEEPLSIDKLTEYNVRAERFENHLRARSGGSIASYTARAILPPGALGEHHLTLCDQRAAIFAQRLRPWLGEGKPTTQAVHLPCGATTLSGLLGPLYDGRLISFRPAKLRAIDRLKAWLLHLIRSTAPDPQATYILTEDAAITYPVVEPGEAVARLEPFVEAYLAGQTRPLPFFPKSALGYVEAVTAGNADPLKPARRHWEGGQQSSEGEDPAYQLCFRGSDPLNAEFETLAMTLLGPMLEATQPLEETSA